MPALILFLVLYVYQKTNVSLRTIRNIGHRAIRVNITDVYLSYIPS
jgi:hypothetical protein